jgi:hypothetical protein
MTAYVYSGTSRSNYTNNILTTNATMTVGSTYLVDVSSDAMMVLIPTKDKTITSFSINYYVSGS